MSTILENAVLENVCQKLGLQYVEDLLDLPSGQVRSDLRKLNKAQLSCVICGLISSFDKFADRMVELGEINKRQQQSIDGLNRQIAELRIENKILHNREIARTLRAG